MNAKEIKKVTLIGSGTMGPGIAQTFARAGLEVFLVDIKQEILDRGMDRIGDNLDVFIELEVIKPGEKEAILSRIHPTTDMEFACRQADYFMEAVQEILERKQQVHRQADHWCRPDVIFTTNASNMQMNPIASVTKRPDRFVGTHWVNPPHIMQLVEVVRGPLASEAAVETVYQFLKRVGKAPVICKDTLSYINNYVQSALGRAALELLEQGVATAEDIDQAVNTGFGFRLPVVGPLAFFDMAGLDNVRDSWEYINKMGGKMGPLPHFILDLIAQGHWGLKTGRGIYSYSEQEIRELAKERNRQLIRMLKALQRI
ncbi:MAG TPA: 3-hydroxyacyl-CoA dehydrogenase family protein [Thermodesulfobacteriota bacterium]|nr:3-hydroxyacyl-CoA dehydrogenase family protein [Thermodesulfobacteriota bacterium]